MGKGVSNKKIPEGAFEIEFYTECPECNLEILVPQVFAIITCPRCGYAFRPVILKARRAQSNPSFRNFRVRRGSTGDELKVS